MAFGKREALCGKIKVMTRIVNRRARHEYFLLERMEAGIALTGAEVKSIRNNRAKLEESFVRLAEDGAWWVNGFIAPYEFADNRDYQPTRTRRLLMHKKEIFNLARKLDTKGLTLVPTACYFKKGRVKLELTLARGKQQWDKREAIKKRDLDRELQQRMRGKK